ncbi:MULTISPECIES: LuxR C-terminal-related transcriptional regulator [unclassified Streptomyces]|uniref:LuxR C-terminal-related transcriptional regulator n=1 Tax=unclassified Streptomyces TaxID=2593676 RepID=UPI0038153334
MRGALDTLSELALVRPSYDHAGSLRALPPELGMEVLMARQQADLAAQQQRVQASRAAAAQLIAECADLRPGTPPSGVEQLLGLDQIRDRLASLTRELTSEVMTFATGGAQSQQAINAAKPLNEDLLARGIRMRTIYLDSIRNHQPTMDYLIWLTENGGEVRTAAALPCRIIITDRTRAVIAVDTDNTAGGAVVLTGQGTVTALCALFDSTWTTAQPLGTRPLRDGKGLTAQEAATLQLLADGHTDVAIAKRLGVSPRTARRIATDLMERLNARSRFQAGTRAVQQGWLPDQP